MLMLEEGECVDADDTYRSETLLYVKFPKSIGHQQEFNEDKQSLVCRSKKQQTRSSSNSSL